MNNRSFRSYNNNDNNFQQGYKATFHIFTNFFCTETPFFSRSSLSDLDFYRKLVVDITGIVLDRHTVTVSKVKFHSQTKLD